jgi:LPXTG-motif cell wall-anchored protein
LTTTATFTDLTPGSYTATVTATNAVGTSSASAASAAVTVTPSDPEPTDPTTVKGSIVVTGDLTPGGTISVAGSGFAKSASGFRVELHSDPILLGTVSTDAEGAFALDATVPKTIEAGAHTVVVLIDGVEVGGSAITLAAADPSDGANPTDDPSAPVVTSAAGSDKDPGRLAFTGSQFVVPIVAAGGLLVLLGAAALVVAKRRKRA